MKKSYISVLILVVLLFASLFIGKLPFSICMAIMAVLSLRELLTIRKKERSFPPELELLSYLLVIFFTMNNFNGKMQFFVLDYRLVAALILVHLTPLVILNDKKKYNFTDSLFLIGSVLFIGLTFNLIIVLRNNNIDYVTYVFLLALSTDLFAHITGHYVGLHTLSSVSPKKSIEGAIGGLLMGTFISTLFFISKIETSLPIYAIVILTGVLSILGQIGDLVFSFIKREYGKKTFSNIVVGDGGILDQLDSIIFVTLGFLMIISIL